jgi:hypothetical protein
MLLIEHRVNTLRHLGQVPQERGIEIDLRDYAGRICLTHEPFEEGDDLKDLLEQYRHSLVIFNVKCDGLEDRIIHLAEKFGIEDYFFLDLPVPTMVKLVQRGMSRVAVRYSEFEPVESALAFAGKAEWVWVDCFTRLPLDEKTYKTLKEHFKICVVSPELQGHGREMIPLFRRQLQGMPVDGVCTDFCGDWESKME